MLQQHIDHDRGTLTLTMARAPVNALNQELYERLHEALKFAEHNTEVKAVLLASQGQKAFSAGADIKEFADLPHDQAEARQLALLLRCLIDFVQFPKPTLAAVSAPAIGAGLMLACACDEIVMADTAWVSLPEVRLQLPTPIGAAIVSRRLRLPAVHALVQRAEQFDAQRCVSEGLADAVVLGENVMTEAHARLMAYADTQTSVYAMNKHWLNRGLIEQLQASADLVSRG